MIRRTLLAAACLLPLAPAGALACPIGFVCPFPTTPTDPCQAMPSLCVPITTTPPGATPMDQVWDTMAIIDQTWPEDATRTFPSGKSYTLNPFGLFGVGVDEGETGEIPQADIDAYLGLGEQPGRGSDVPAGDDDLGDQGPASDLMQGGGGGGDISGGPRKTLWPRTPKTDKAKSATADLPGLSDHDRALIAIGGPSLAGRSNSAKAALDEANQKAAGLASERNRLNGILKQAYGDPEAREEVREIQDKIADLDRRIHDLVDPARRAHDQAVRDEDRFNEIADENPLVIAAQGIGVNAELYPGESWESRAESLARRLGDLENDLADIDDKVTVLEEELRQAEAERARFPRTPTFSGRFTNDARGEKRFRGDQAKLDARRAFLDRDIKARRDEIRDLKQQGDRLEQKINGTADQFGRALRFANDQAGDSATAPAP